MPTLSPAAGAHPKTVPVTFGDETFKITYDVGRYTGAFEAQINEVHGEGRPVGTASAFVAGLVLEWDVQKPDGSLYPIDLETILGFPAEFTGLIVSAIVEDARPGEVSGSFGAGSPAAV